MLLERERTGGAGDTPPHTPLSSLDQMVEEEVEKNKLG